VKRFIGICILMFFISLSHAQSRRMAYLTTYDLKKIHFGFTLGLNALDFGVVHFPSLDNNPAFIASAIDSAYLSELDAVGRVVRSDVSSLIPGFTVAIVSSYRLSEYLELRFLPGLSFGNRNMVFNVPLHDINRVDDMRFYSVRSTYLDFPLLVKYKAKRMTNQRPYLIAGGAYRLDIARSAEDDLIQLQPNNLFLELGVGWDSYLHYFRFSTEIKFGLGLNNILGREPEFPQPAYYTHAIQRLTSNIVTLSFHFE
jgi:hypothetical protein